MKSFFFKTYYFWLFTRIIFIAAAIIDSFTTFPKALNKVDLLIDFATVLYIALMIYNTVVELQDKTRNRIAKTIAGISSIVIAVSILIIVLLYDRSYLLGALIFVTWMILLGMFDLLIINRHENGQEEDSDLPG